MNTVVGYPIAGQATSGANGAGAGTITAGAHARGSGRETKTGPDLRKVFICSPYRPQGTTEAEREKEIRYNIRLAQYASRYAVMAGYVPYAPHLYFPQMLDDDNRMEREMGITLGLTWLARCDELWIIEHHISEGMKKEIKQAQEWGIPVKHFCLPRSIEERLLDAIFTPDIQYYEMKMEDEDHED